MTLFVDRSVLKEKLKRTILYNLYTFRQAELNRFVQAHYAGEPDSEIHRVRTRMAFARIAYGLPYADFFQCRCDDMNNKQLSQIVPLSEQKRLWKKVNSKRAHDLLCDKYQTYNFFQAYYDRQVVSVDDFSSTDIYDAFLAAHNCFIVKPKGANCGRGIRLLDREKDSFSLKDMLKEYPNGFILEEIISQDERLAAFHPSSVNTLRINTFYDGDSVEVKWPCLRVGRKGSIVDNAGAGGVFGAIDVATGRILAASDEFHHTFEIHPDTEMPIIGFQIPRWDEAVAMAKTLARMIPDAHFVAWDFALTEKGWVMVEGNYGPLLIWQIAVGRGIRNEFEKMEKRLALK